MGIARLTKDPAATPIARWVSAPPDGAIHTEPQSNAAPTPSEAPSCASSHERELQRQPAALNPPVKDSQNWTPSLSWGTAN